VLLKYAPVTPTTGTFLDIGCGWGPLAVALALEAPEASVFGVDVNDRALQVARDNAENLGLTNITVTQPHDVPEALSFDLIWSNPPIRVGKQALHEILALWLPRLSPEGEAYLVVAKKLGADSLLEWLNSGAIPHIRAERLETSRGYRILRVTRA
jgi:16S rRNA G1207 methylase RsmC